MLMLTMMQHYESLDNQLEKMALLIKMKISVLLHIYNGQA